MEWLLQLTASPVYATADPPRLCELETVVQSIIRVALAAGGVALFVMILWGGFMWLTAGGNDQQVAAARGTITWAVLGLVLMMLSYFILLMISQFTGVDVTGFSIPWFGGTRPAGCPT